MIKFRLKDGRVLDNDLRLGLNIDDPELIRAVLKDGGWYYLTYEPGQTIKLTADDVAEIYETN